MKRESWIILEKWRKLKKRKGKTKTKTITITITKTKTTKTKTRLIFINVTERQSIYGLNDRILNLDNYVLKKSWKKSFTKSKWWYREEKSNLNDCFLNILRVRCL